MIGNDPVSVGVPDRFPDGESATPPGSMPLPIEKLALSFAPVCMNVAASGASFVNVVFIGLVTLID